jgi:hypothetical protein
MQPAHGDRLMTIPFPDPDPCDALRCDKRAEHIRECREARCGFEWARTSREDRRRREEWDRNARIGAPSPSRNARSPQSREVE